MTVSECERFVALSDQDAVGEPLSALEARFLLEHAEGCAACGAEQRAFDALSSALDSPSLLSEPFRLEARPRGLARVTHAVKHARRTTLLAAAACVAAAAVAAPALKRTLSQTHMAASAPLVASTATLILRAGNALVDGNSVSVGTHLTQGSRLEVRVGRACAGFEPGVWACLGEHSSANVQALGEQRTLKLLSGRVLARLDPQPAGRTFAVESAAVSVLAKGTLFAVEIGEHQETAVRLYEGSVRLRARDGRELLLRAPAEARVGSNIEAHLFTSAIPARDQELIALTRVAGQKSDSELSVTSSPSGAAVALDGVALGPAPLSALVRDGNQRLSVELPGYAQVTERLVLIKGAPVTRDYELTPLRTAASAEPALAQRPAPEAAGGDVHAKPSELLTKARAARASGRYAEAARIYRQLMQTFPQSAEARVSQVSLGELWLSELSDPRAALASFDAYLKQGGGLNQEARYGRIRALGRLGRSAEERAAIEQFLADYPKSVQATSLRAKLQNR